VIVLLHLFQKRVAIHDWHLEIEHHQVGPGRSCIAGGALIEVVQRFRTVAAAVDVDVWTGVLTELGEEVRVVWVVVNQQDGDWALGPIGKHMCSPLTRLSLEFEKPQPSKLSCTDQLLDVWHTHVY